MNDETFERVIARIESLQTAYAETRQNWQQMAINESEDVLLPLSVLAGVVSEDFKRLLDFVEALRTEAAPEPKKPWYDAEPGEVWVITFENEKLYALVDEDCDFVISDETAGRSWVSMRHPAITAGHRVLEAL